MAHHIKVLLLLIFTTAAAPTADVEEPLSEDYFDQLVQDALKRTERGTCPGCCPLGWVKFDGRCYSYHSVNMDWASAEKHCLSLGANMLSVHNENEYQLAKSLIRSYNSMENPTWLGLSNCQQRYNWFWSDGTKCTFTKWNIGEPDFQYGECCALMNWGVWKDWCDAPCERSYPFVCVKRIN